MTGQDAGRRGEVRESIAYAVKCAALSQPQMGVDWANPSNQRWLDVADQIMTTFVDAAVAEAVHERDEEIARLRAAFIDRGLRLDKEVAEAVSRERERVRVYMENEIAEARHEERALWLPEVQALTEERNTLRTALVDREGALEFTLLADEVRELRLELATLRPASAPEGETT